MSTSKPLFIVSLVTISLAASAWAGNSGGGSDDGRNNPWNILAHPPYRPREHRGPMKVVKFAGKVVETLLSGPQIFAETVYGDRTLVSKRGVLAPREVPTEDLYLAPGEE